MSGSTPAYAILNPSEPALRASQSRSSSTARNDSQPRPPHGRFCRPRQMGFAVWTWILATPYFAFSRQRTMVRNPVSSNCMEALASPTPCNAPKTASGSKKLTISKREWQSIGKKAGWMKEAQGRMNRNDEETSSTTGKSLLPSEQDSTCKKCGKPAVKSQLCKDCGRGKGYQPVKTPQWDAKKWEDTSEMWPRKVRPRT